MVYIFGDLRQLRKFELSRPPISRPQVLSNPRQRPLISPPLSLPVSSPIIQPPTLTASRSGGLSVPPQLPRLDIPSHPQPAMTQESPRVRSLSSSSSASTSTHSTTSDTGSASVSSSSASEGHNHALTIEIGPAFYDDSHIEGPATGSPGSPTRYYAFPSKQDDYLDNKNRPSVAEFTPTASFIHPYDPLCDDDFDGSRELTPEERQGIGAFDFDLLPKRGYTFPERDRVVSVATNGTMDTPSMVEKGREDVLVGFRSPKDILGRVQHKGNKQKRTSSEPEKPSASRNSSCSRRTVDPAAQLKVIKAVPAFASPFTRVLNPVVTRAQWEIVVRSAAVAGLICWTIVGCLVAIPVRR